MLKLVQVPAKTFHRYKQEDSFLEEGKYYQFMGKPTDSQKKIYSLIAAQGPGLKFGWLAPFEPWVKRIHDGQLITEPIIDEEPDWDMLGLQPQLLRNWQKQVIKSVWNYLRCGLRYGKGCIAKLGAGKTLAGLSIAQMFEPEEVAVLVDRYLHSTWEDEAESWGLNTPLISTYESCHKLPKGIKCLIVDEILRLKNPEALRSIRASRISETCEVAVGFTGIATGGKGPMDFRWLRVVVPGCVPADENSWKFLFGLDTELKEVGPNKAYITTQWDDDKVAEFVAPFIYTVDPNEINAELPDITYTYINCPKPKEYDLVKSGGATAKGVHKKLAQLRQVTDGFVYDDDDRPVRIKNPKIKQAREFIETLGEPVVLVTNWTEGVEILREEFAEFKPVVVSGQTKDTGAAIRAFQQGSTGMLIANAGFSKGMNLQKVCRVVCFFSVSTKPDDYQQMIGRVYRPGQKDAVQIVHFVCEGTMDRRIIELVQNHKDMSDAFIEELLIKELEK